NRIHRREGADRFKGCEARQVPMEAERPEAELHQGRGRVGRSEQGTNRHHLDVGKVTDRLTKALQPTAARIPAFRDIQWLQRAGCPPSSTMYWRPPASKNAGRAMPSVNGIKPIVRAERRGTGHSVSDYRTKLAPHTELPRWRTGNLCSQPGL